MSKLIVYVCINVEMIRNMRRQIFHGSIFANTREEVIEELKWWIEQLELDADGGGTDNQEVQGTWTLEEGEDK